jgi:hypothetical protein
MIFLLITIGKSWDILTTGMGLFQDISGLYFCSTPEQDFFQVLQGLSLDVRKSQDSKFSALKLQRMK